MKLIKVLLLTLCLSALVPQLALSQESSAAGRLRRRAAAIPNNYIVVFKDSVPQGRVKAFAEQLARTHGGTIGFTYQHALRGFSVELSESQALALSRNPQVEYVEEDTLVEGAGVQSNPTWALDRIDQRNLPLNASYNYANSGAGVNAYIIDSGIRFTHQEFNGRALFAYDNVGDGRNGVDCNGHGTHVAGIVGGKTYGVAKDAKLWSVRVLNCTNGGTTARIIAGVDWVAANHVKPAVTNLSFITIAASDTIDLAVRNLIAAGVTTVVAAGNNTGDASLRSPARVTEAITVAAVDQFDNQSPNSNFGPAVDVYAPGVDIVSAWAADDVMTNIRSGTSSAAAFVTGLAARYLASRPGDQPGAVSQAILNAATPGKIVNPGVGSPNLLAYAPITLNDDFNDNMRDAAKWNAPRAADFTIVEQNGRLEITPDASTASYEGYKSATTIDLTDARVSVEASIPQFTSGYIIDGFGSCFMLGQPDGNNLAFRIGPNGLMMMQQGMLLKSIVYNVPEHRFWRIRHNRANDTINWEVSPDGVTWTVLHSAPRPFSITDLQIVLTAGKWSVATQTTKATFDNLWHEPNPMVSVAMADNFDDNMINPTMWSVLDATSPTTVTEQNGRIDVTSYMNFNGLNLVGSFDFRNKSVQVEVGDTRESNYFRLYLDASNYFEFRSQGGHTLSLYKMPNPNYDTSSVRWDAANMRYWRFRHDSDTNTVNFDTSGDGATWTTYRTVAADFDLRSVRTMIGARVPYPIRLVGWNYHYFNTYFDNFRVDSYKHPFPQSDDFHDNMRDIKKWSVPEATDFTIVEQNGRLEITPGASIGHEGYTSVVPIDLTDARAAVKVALTAPPINGFGTYLVMGDTSGNNLLFGIDGSDLLMQYGTTPTPTPITGDVTSRVRIPYDAVQHRRWRIRHNRAADTIVWETSGDSGVWTAQYTVPRPFALTNLQTRLIAGMNAATTPTITAVFDDLQIERNEGGQAR